MSYYYPQAGLPPAQPSADASKPPLYATQAPGAAQRLPGVGVGPGVGAGAPAYHQHSSMPSGAGLIRPTVMSAAPAGGIPRPVAVSMPMSYAPSSYPASNVYPSAGQNSLYASSALAYAAQQTGNHAPAGPAPGPTPGQPNPYLGPAAIPGGHYRGTTPAAPAGYTVITSSAGMYSNPSYNQPPLSSAIKPYPPPGAANQPRPASIYQPQPAVAPLGGMSSYQALQPQHHQPGTGPPPLMGAAPPGYHQPGTVPSLYVRPM